MHKDYNQFQHNYNTILSTHLQDPLYTARDINRDLANLYQDATNELIQLDKSYGIKSLVERSHKEEQALNALINLLPVLSINGSEAVEKLLLKARIKGIYYDGIVNHDLILEQLKNDLGAQQDQLKMAYALSMSLVLLKSHLLIEEDLGAYHEIESRAKGVVNSKNETEKVLKKVRRENKKAIAQNSTGYELAIGYLKIANKLQSSNNGVSYNMKPLAKILFSYYYFAFPDYGTRKLRRHFFPILSLLYPELKWHKSKESYQKEGGTLKKKSVGKNYGIYKESMVKNIIGSQSTLKLLNDVEKMLSTNLIDDSTALKLADGMNSYLNPLP